MWPDRIRTDPGYARHLVFKRDRGVCASCDTDTVNVRARELHRTAGRGAIRRKANAMWGGRPPRAGAQFTAYAIWSGSRDAELFRWARVTFPQPKGRHRWEMDHIIPVIEGGEGGEGGGLDNLRTLCIACHKAETKALAGRRAAAKRAQLELGEVS